MLTFGQRTLELAVSSYGKIDLKTIAAIWLFDEGSGQTAKDSSGNENHGELMNGVEWIDCVFGKALELDGQDDYVFVAGSQKAKKRIRFSSRHL